MEEERILTPWEVKGSVDYLAQITKFGTKPIDGELIKRWENVTKCKVHHFIRRGIVFSHQDLDRILDSVEQGIPVYIYTGRGPSSDVLHLGHLVPFKLTCYLQKALNCIVVIEMSDIEKYFFKDGSGPIDLDTYRKYSYSNARDIIACGFDPQKTFIFSNLEYNSADFHFNNALLMKNINISTIKATFGVGEILPPSVIDVLSKELVLEESKIDSERDSKKIDELRGTLKKFSGQQANNVGQIAWPAQQAAPAFATSFKTIFCKAIEKSLKKSESIPSIVKHNMNKVYLQLKTLGSTQSMLCLVSLGIDQTPFFRMARDSAATLLCPKPAVIHSEFLPGLKQSSSKMGTTAEDAKNSTIFLNMLPKDIGKKIKQHAYSGGMDSMEEHKLYGGDIRIDSSYIYLTFFMESDETLKDIADRYTRGSMGSGDLKKITADIVSKEVETHQKNRELVTDEVIKHFFNANRDFDIGGLHDKQNLDTKDNLYTDYANYGIDFNRTFGMQCKTKPGVNHNQYSNK